MSNHFSQSLPDHAQSESELQTWAEQMLQRPRSLQELPLIFVSDSLLKLTEQRRRDAPTVQSAIQTWLQEARLDDQRLRIERRLIPHTPIYLPETPDGQQFFKFAQAIATIPLNAAVLPKNQNQGYWFKTLHYHWQARSVAIAQRLLGVISDPLGEDGALKDRLSDKNLEHLRLSSSVDVACFKLLTQGEGYIKAWAKENQIAYPFETPLDLFLQLLKEEFLITWQLGPGNSERQAVSKAQRRDNLAIRVRLLKQFPWPETSSRPDYDLTEQKYLHYLEQAGWSGYWLLALRSHLYDSRIDSLWEAYVRSLSKTKEIAVEPLDWLNGEAFDRPVSNPHRSVEASLDLLGYIHWHWT